MGSGQVTAPAKTDILQFGTSRFLQAHADLFFSEADPPKSVTVVQTSGDRERAKRLPALVAPSGIPIKIRGLADGQTIDEERRVTSIKQVYSAALHWHAICAVAEEADCFLSNTSDIGFDPHPADFAPKLDPEASFPAKLTHLLAHRFQAGKAPPLLLPTELLPDNGDALKTRALEIAEAALPIPGFQDWLHAMPAANSIVDRIVSEPLRPAGAVAEPYALWAIEARAGVRAPCAHTAIQIVPSLEVPERLKLHILNLGHTVLADWWRGEGAPEGKTVLDYMRSDKRKDLRHLFQTEVLPIFAGRNFEDQARAYIDTTLERFENPFLAHQVSDIAVNHEQKVQRRIVGLLDWGRKPDALTSPILQSVIERAAG